MIAQTPTAPYYAVIFTSQKKDNTEGYEATANKMFDMIEDQEGFLGLEHAGGDSSINISYWKDVQSIMAWRQNQDHKAAQEQGKAEWYAGYKVRICQVQRDYDMGM